MTHKTAAWYDYLTGRKLGLWVYDNWMGGKLLNSAIANNDPPVGKARVLQERLNKGLLLTGAVKENVINPIKNGAKDVGSYLYNTGFTGRWLLTLISSRNSLKHAQLQQNKSFQLSKQFFDLKNSLGYKNLLQRKNQPDFSAQLAKQLDEYLSQLRRLKYLSEGAQKLYLTSMADYRGYQAQHLTALRHIPWASMIHTVANYNGLLTTARDIYDPRNWNSMVKGIPAQHKKVLDQQNTHSAYTDTGDLIHAALLSNLVLPHGLAKATPVVAQTLSGIGSRVGMPWLRHAATPTVLAGATVLGAGVQSLLQNGFAWRQRKLDASYGNPNQALALIPGAVFANYGGFALLMDIQNQRRQRLTLVLNTPDDEIDRRFNTKQLDKVPYIDAGTVYNAAMPAVLTRITRPLAVVDNFTNYLQYGVPVVPPDWRKYIQAADVSAQVALHTTSPGNSSVVNDNNLIEASKWVKDAYYYNFPGRRYQIRQNKTLPAQPDLGFRFAGAVMNSALNKLPLPALPDPRTLWTLDGTPRTPYANAQLLSVTTAYLLDNDNVFGAMQLLPGATEDPRLAGIKKYYKDSMEHFLAGTTPDQRLAALNAYYKRYYANSSARKELTPAQRQWHWLNSALKLKLPKTIILDYIQGIQ